MKIVVLAESFSEDMGYATNFYPKALAEQGHEVHIITTNTQPYFSSPDYKSIFERFIGPGIVSCSVKPWKGTTLHRLPYKLWPRRTVGIKGLMKAIIDLKPDIVHSMGLWTEFNYEVALLKPFMPFKYFFECHIHASVFPPFIVKVRTPQRWLYWHAYRPLVGKMINAASEKCWAISEDAGEIARDFFGIDERKIALRSLGTDVSLFKPWYDEDLQERRKFRQQLGFSEKDIVCIYTGRNQEGKDPLILARAIDALVKQGKPYRAIFIGDGAEDYTNSMRQNKGCNICSFVPVDQLPLYYQAADIGVWPKQESTSQMDAAACGLPLVLSNRVRAHERIKDNALVYEENDMADLTAQLLKLADPVLRRKMGEVGAKRMREQCSWQKIAQEAIKEYEKALGK